MNVCQESGYLRRPRRGKAVSFTISFFIQVGILAHGIVLPTFRELGWGGSSLLS